MCIRDSVETVRGAGAEYLEDIQFGEIYRGEQVEEGSKSVFLTLVFRAPDRTLTHDEITESQKAIVAALADRLAATLRT